MSSIEKLSIRGIRSFSPNREEIIEFYHPLTVILGDNGCGKTTIIECLKIACTGSLPPGSRAGQSFVHDPKIAGTNEVKASIRLRFRNCAGKAMVVQRTYQLTQQKASLKFKAMDGVIRVVNDLGEKVSMSHKCGELDRHIPEVLGVSKAILESVIFCHQEESNWPLQEGAELKKRFDAIFESARYTKALEAIKKLRKARFTDTKDFKRDLDVLSVQMKAADAIRTKIDAAQQKLAAVLTDAAHATDNVEQAEEALAELTTLQRTIDDLEQTLARTESDVLAKDERAKHAFDNIAQLLNDADAELEALLVNYDTTVGAQQSAYEALKRDETQLTTQQHAADAALTKLAETKGKLDARVEATHTRVLELVALAATLRTKYALATPLLTDADATTPRALDAFMGAFKRVVQAKQAAVQDVESANQRAEDALNADVSDLQSKLHHAREELKAKQRDLATLTHEKRAVATTLAQLSGHAMPTERDVADAERVIQDAERALQLYKTQHDVGALKIQIETINRDVNDATYASNAFDQRLEVLRASEHDHIALDSKRDDLRHKTDALRAKLAERARESHDVLAASGLASSSSRDALPAIVAHVDTVVADRLRARDAAQRALAAAERALQENALVRKNTDATLATLRADKLALERNELSVVQQHIADVLPNAPLADAEQALAKLEKLYFDAKDKTLRCKNTITFLNIFKRKGETEACCPLCLRGLDADELAAFRDAINDKTDDRKVRDKIHRAEQQEQVTHERWKDMDKHMPSWRKWQRIEAQLPATIAALDALLNTQPTLAADVNDRKFQLESAQRALDDAQRAQREFAALAEANDELVRTQRRLDDELAQLQSNATEMLSASSDGDNTLMTIADVQAARDRKQTDVKELMQKQQRKQSELQQQQEIQQQKQSELLKKREALLALEHKRQAFVAAQSEQSKLREREKALRDAEVALRESEPKLDRAVRTKRNERDSRRAAATTQRNQLHAELQQFVGDLQTFNDRATQVDARAAQTLERDREALATKMAQLQQARASAAHELEALAPRVATALQNLQDQETQRRQIRDNVEYRRLTRDVADAKRDVDAVRAQLAALPAIADVDRKVRTAQAAVEHARDSRAELNGRKKQLDDTVREYKIQLRQSDFRDVDAKHRHKLIEFETTTMAVADLDRYYRALDQALIEYHSKKIEEINTIIRSLWQITYKGQDIDSIEIVSGQEVGAEATAMKATRSYDYRVVMKKAGARIDMRGRCSAGQKVLAALVIRLALAETFCLNCGILALDEPTTNLDTENKYGLAQAITDLLTARSSQQNFQLVCITHDEEFVQMLGRTQAMDNSSPEFYWRIAREDMDDVILDLMHIERNRQLSGGPGSANASPAKDRM